MSQYQQAQSRNVLPYLSDTKSIRTNTLFVSRQEKLTLSNESYWFQNFFCSTGHTGKTKTDICLVRVIVSFYIEVGLGQTLTKVSDKF